MIVNLKEQHCENFLQSLHKEQWQEVRLGEVAKQIVSGGTPKSTQAEYYNGNIPWLNTKEVKNCRIYATERQITELGLCNSSAKWIDKNSVIVAMYGATAGKVAINKIPLTTNQACCNISVDSEKANYNFIYYTLLDSFDRLDQMTSGAAQQNLNVGLISNFTFLLPPLTTQQKIAEILSSFDDKIDLLHRQNKTLESLALTLFRHYFIDNPKRDEWKLGKLGDYVKIIDNRGKTPPFTTDITPYPLIEVNALSDDSMLINYDIVRKYVIKETYQNWFREHIKQYDILFSTVGSIGEVAMLLDNKGCIAQNVIGFRAREISPFYLYEWLKYMQQEIKEFDIGSVQPSIKVTHFVEKQIYKPDSKILESFDKQMLLITDKISHNAKQIQNLQAMRDILLKAIFA